MTERTTGSDARLGAPGPGDFDPKISPDGTLLASYRHLSDGLPLFGDYDIWVGPYAGPGPSISLLAPDDTVADLFPRWNLSGDKLAAWRFAPNAPAGVNIVIYDVTLQQSPFSASAVVTDITSGEGWSESMPSWNTDPARADTLVYSGERQR